MRWKCKGNWGKKEEVALPEVPKGGERKRGKRVEGIRGSGGKY